MRHPPLCPPPKVPDADNPEVACIRSPLEAIPATAPTLHSVGSEGAPTTQQLSSPAGPAQMANPTEDLQKWI